MKKSRRKFSKEFKLKVVLEALQERSTLNELGEKYELHPNQISFFIGISLQGILHDLPYSQLLPN